MCVCGIHLEERDLKEERIFSALKEIRPRLIFVLSFRRIVIYLEDNLGDIVIIPSV